LGAGPVLRGAHRPGQQRQLEDAARRYRQSRRQVLDRIGDELRARRYRLRDIGEGPLGAPRQVIPFAVTIVALGDDAARAPENAAAVMRLETELAGASRKLEDLRDPQKNYNAMSLDEVTAITPSIRWREFLEEDISLV